MNVPAKIRIFLKKRFPLLAMIHDVAGRSYYKFMTALTRKIQEIRMPPYRKYSSGIGVFYITNDYPQRPPTRHQYAHGGMVKTVYLSESFPHSSPSANILYAVSSIGCPQASQIVTMAKKRKLKVVVNQNGVAYQAWHGPGWENTNQLLKMLVHQADYIIYQSRFCQFGAEYFLSPPNVPHDVIYNPVDTNLFTPVSYSTKPQELTLLLGGSQNERYRFELAIQVLSEINRINPHVRLIVTGHLWNPREEAEVWTRNLLDQLHLSEKVIFTGKYSQQEAPSIFNQAHILLHTQYSDASPTLVLEAMASGLPVVYIDSGGTPELVGDAGIGIPVEHSWEKINLPEPQDMGNAVLQIKSRYEDFSSQARERAVKLFSLEMFMEKHRKIFEKILEL